MLGTKPSNKIYVVIVICVGLVISVWLLQSSGSVRALGVENTGTLSGNPYRNIEKNTDWQKILTTVDNSATDTSLISKKSNSSVSEEDFTLTDQMSRDFLSQYLLAVKNKGGITSDEATQIAQNTLLLPDYTQSTGAKYISANLKVNSATDYNTLRTYRDKLYLILKERSSSIKDDPLSLVVSALTTENSKDLSKLAPIITQNKGLISDLLVLEVPKNAVSLHLSLLNASSNILANLEGMRDVLNDPVKGLAGIGEYSQNFMNLNNSIQNFTKFFQQNL